MSSPITPLDPLWHSSYPAFRAPAPGESLAGFLLALDDLNGLPAGTSVWAVKNRGLSLTIFNVPAPFLRGVSLNFQEIAAAAGGRAVRDIEALTLRPLLTWCAGESVATKIGSASFKICPGCAVDKRLSLVSLLQPLSAGCARHGLELVGSCPCGAPIQPFLGQRTFTCHGLGCPRSYAELPAVPLNEAVRSELKHRTVVYEQLLAQGLIGTPRIDGERHLSRALGLLVHLSSARQPEHQELLRRSNTPRPGLTVVADVLLTTGASVADLVGALEETRTASRARISPSRCPNPACGGSDLLVCAREQQCRACGTRFTARRILFSFDAQPGFSRWRALANQRRLADSQGRVRKLGDEWLGVDRTIERESILRAAHIATGSIPHLSPRAGLGAIVLELQARQRAARTAAGSAALATIIDPKHRRRAEVFVRARVVGVRPACRELGFKQSWYYRWKKRVDTDGLGVLAQSSRCRAERTHD
jgi:hypothetical protein